MTFQNTALNTIDSNIYLSNLTNSQLRIWTGQRLDPDIPLYNMALAFFIQGKLDPKSFRDAFSAMVDRSDTLKTVINEYQGVPQQRVLDKLNYNLDFIDFSKKPDSHDAIQPWLRKRTVKQFNMEKQLFDSALIKVSEGNFVWFLNQHHLITDGWSCAIVYRRMAEFYQLALNDRLNDAPQLPLYSDYQVYERDFQTSKSSLKAKAYWQNKTSNPIIPLDLYGNTPSDKETRTERVFCDIGLERTEKLRTLAQEKEFRSFSTHLSLFNIFSALLFAYLYRISGNSRLVIGSPAHNRPTATFKETIGLFIELFPLEINISPGETFRSLIKAIEPESIEFLRNALPGASQSLSGDNYSVVLNYINANFPDFYGMPMKSTWIHPDHGDRGHALRLQVQDFDLSGRIQLHFDFSCEIFNHDLRQQAVEHFLKLVDALLKNPNQSIERINLLGPDERKAIIYHRNETQSKRPRDATVIDLFNQQAAKTPHVNAVIDSEQQITYLDLNFQSDQIAYYLQKAGVARESMVGVFLERSAELIIAILGIMKAGAAFVPIDASFPKKRIEFLLNDCHPLVVLTQENLKDRLPESSAELFCLDSDREQLTKDQRLWTERPANPSNMAYVIYTSGSTGVPKGVVIEHGSLMNYLIWAQKQYMLDGPHDFPLFSTIAADLTITSIFLPLISGGKIVVYPEPNDGVDLSVLNAYEDDAVDIIKLTPSHLSMLIEKNRASKRLKKLIVGGEDFKTSLAHKVSGLFNGNIEIYNEYGPTEATVGCMIHRFDAAKDQSHSVAIGKPIDNMQIYLLDAGLNPVPVGVKGDIYIAGMGLARGYLNLPKLTSQSFVSNPFQTDKKMYRSGDLGRWNSSGMLEFHGRKDHQVKVRGFRIELGEIEAALLDFPGVRESYSQVIDHHRSVTDIDVSYCKKCGLASNHPQSKLDEQGICQICLNFEKQRDIAQKYFKEEKDFHRILAHARKASTGKYDCLMQYSGGKDSTYALYKLVEMGAHPLVFSFDNGYISDGAKDNIRRVVDDLKLDLEWGRTPAMKEIFVDSLRRFSNVCNGCQKVINTLSVNLAREKGIHYIVTGLSRGQFFETRVSELFNNSIFNSEDIDGYIIEGRKAYHRMDDAVSQNLDVSAFREDSIFEDIQFVDFYRYCNVELQKILKFLDQRAPWIRPDDTGRSTNCMINEAGIHIHKKERGFHNYSLPYSWDVRLGHKERDSALEELDDDIDETRVKKILEAIGYDPEEKTYSSSDHRIVAYYTADKDFPPDELRSFLSYTLPPYMIPAHFIRMDSFPLNATGKVDRDALPLPDDGRARLPSEYVAPRNEVEKILIDIWANVMGNDNVGIHDNFFDLGGDSILSIQIVARAVKNGLEFTPGLLFQYPSVADLAANIDNSKAIKADQDNVVGLVPLTPIQQWFFELKLPQPQIWNMTLKLDILEEVNPRILEEAFEHMINHHDSLRLSFRKTSEWEQYLSENENLFRIENHNLSKQPVQDQARSIERIVQKAQTTLNLQTGPLVKPLLFERGDKQDSLLVIIIHHLAVDGVSWYIILEDLESLYFQLAAGKGPILPNKTTSFKQWSNKLVRYANSPTGEAEVDYWRGLGRKPATPIPRDAGLPGNGQESSSETMVTRLDQRYNQTLLQKAALSGRISVEELLLGALMQTLCRWTGSSSVRLDKEGHGREGVIEDAALYRTLGWFTSIYPVNLVLPEKQGSRQVIRAVKDQVRTIPNRGFGYGPLRYLNTNRAINNDLKAIPKSEVLFNYLGVLNQMTGPSNLFRLNGPFQAIRDPSGRRPYLLEINAFVIDGQLEIYWTFNTELHKPETIRKISAEVLRALKKLINYCLRLSDDDPRSIDPLQAHPTFRETQDFNNVEAEYALSPLQSGILFHTLKEPGSGVYVEQYGCTLTGNLKPELFQQAWQLIVQQNQVLRTEFTWDAQGETIQLVRRKVELDWNVKDLKGKSEAEISLFLENYLREDRVRGFSLDRAPLMRFRLFHITEHKYHFVWSFHHILFDGWSTPLIIKQVFQNYHSLCNGETPDSKTDRPFQDFISWLQKQDLSRAERFWKDQLKGFSGTKPLSISRFQKGRSGYDQKELPLSSQLSAELVATTRSKRLTLNAVIQGIWAILLHRYNGEKDIVFGATVSGRPPTMDGVERMIGLFINTLPVRAIIEPDTSLSLWLAQLMGKQSETRDFEYSPLPKVKEWSETPIGVPLFDTIIVFENYPVAEPAGGHNLEFHISDITYREQSNYPLSILVLPEDNIRIIAVYDQSLFTESSISKLLSHLTTLLQSFATHPDQLIKELTVLTGSDQQLLSEWRGTDNVALTEKPVHRLFENRVAQDSTKDAVIYQAQCMTYGEINSRANRLANYLLDHGAGSGAIFGIYIDRSIEMVLAIMAVLKSGSAYVPLDPTYPAKRVAFMMADARVTMVLTLERLKRSLPNTQLTAISIDNDSLRLNNYSDANPDPSILPNNLAYIIYTSGSTGAPKGVMINHGNLTHSTGERIRYYEDAPERFLLLSSISFDSSVAGIFGTLCRGGSLYIPDQENYRDIKYLASLIAKHRITHTLTIPSLYHNLLKYYRPDIGSLKTVTVAGEPCTRDIVMEHQSSLPDAQLYNEYGPTEATVWSTVFDCLQSISSTSVPIGIPINNTYIYILDNDLRLVPPGVPGELYLGGPGISAGYVNQPEMTAERFIPNSLDGDGEAKLYKTGDIVYFLNDGNLVYLGRNDEQIKIRGYRIELGEVEAALLSLNTIKQAVVIPSGSDGNHSRQTDDSVKQLGNSPNRLKSFVVPEKGKTVKPEELRELLAIKLPEYMIPSDIIPLESIPLSPSGKVDRNALSGINSNRSKLDTELVEPKTPLEKELARIWSEVLSHRQVSMKDNFFEMGGDSLMAVKLFALIKDRVGPDLPLSILFETPILEGLVAKIKAERERDNFRSKNQTKYNQIQSSISVQQNFWEALVPIRAEGNLLPLFLMHGIGGNVLNYQALIPYLNKRQPVFGLQARGLDGISEPFQDVYEMASHYVREILKIHPHGPYLLGGGSMGGALSLEMAQQLRMQGKRILFLGLFDTISPFVKYPFEKSSFFAKIKDVLKSSTNVNSFLERLYGAVTKRIRYVYFQTICHIYRLLRRPIPQTFRYWYITEHHMKIMNKYQPKPYSGHITLFRSTFATDDSLDRGWGTIALNGLEIIQIPALHRELVESAELGRELSSCIEKVQKKYEDPTPNNDILE